MFSMRVIQIVQGVAFITEVECTFEELKLNNILSYFPRMLLFIGVEEIFRCP